MNTLVIDGFISGHLVTGGLADNTATAYTVTGPSSGTVSQASTNFTVSPNGQYSGTITITPSGGGLTNPVVLSFSPSSVPQTFTITPVSVGTVTLTFTNDGGLTNPLPLTYSVTDSVGLTVYPDPFAATSRLKGN